MGQVTTSLTGVAWLAGRFWVVQSAQQVIAVLAGVAVFTGTLWAMVLTVIVPRSERPLTTTLLFKSVASIVHGIARRIDDPVRRDRIESRLAPISLMLLPFLWAALVALGFALVFWGLGAGSLLDSIFLSGSSITTLGIRDGEGPAQMLFIVLEGIIGLGLVAVMVSYWPTIYGAYTNREIAVARLEVRAGRPPHPVTFLERTNRIGMLHKTDAVWREWEQWFLEIEETHTTHTSLPHFRSAYYGRTWLIAAGTVLDVAALMQTTVDVEPTATASLCLRSGFTTLRSIAVAFEVEAPVDPRFPNDPISIDRATFDEVYDELERRGVPVRPDRAKAWHAFAGWRVNYDAALFGLFAKLRMDPGPWFDQLIISPEDLSRPDLYRYED